MVEQGLFRLLGIKIDPGPVGAFGHYAHPIIMYQAMGGMIVLVLIGLWNARGHLRAVWRKALTGAEDVDDADEIMSYRQAVLGGLLGLGVMSAWLWHAGLPLWLVPILLGACFVLFLTITRVVAEGGVVVMFPPITWARLCLGRGWHCAAGSSRWGRSGHHLRLGHGRAHPADERLRQRPQTGRADRPATKGACSGPLWAQS